jgi:hypothetical protein
VPEEIPFGSVIEFNYILPVSDERCRQNIEASLERELPDAVERHKLIIIANGPTARNVDLRKIVHATLALNGSIKLFMEQGLAPTYWAVCDPQEHVANFIPDDPPQETIYFVASKCHPTVFEKLKGRKVYLWHISDHHAPERWHVAPSSSVTITACWLMNRLGWTDFEFWGWDGCFMDGKHHASNNDDWSAVPVVTLNYGGKMEGNQIIGGKEFSTTRTWAAEARGAEQFFQLAEYFDIGIKIHGDGMMECARKSIMDKEI